LVARRNFCVSAKEFPVRIRASARRTIRPRAIGFLGAIALSRDASRGIVPEGRRLLARSLRKVRQPTELSRARTNFRNASKLARSGARRRTADVSFLEGVAAAGLVLLFMAMLSGWVRRLPVATSLLYLLVGVGIGPLGLGWLRLDLVDRALLVERATELAVVASLFIGGLKLRLDLTHRSWRSGYRLATLAMLLSIAGVAALAHWLLGLSWPSSLLLGAIVAPTDPVLAGMVAVDAPSDRDPVRYALSSEAGLNDGMAFPLVALALLLAGHGESSLGAWALHYLWGIPAAFAFGFLLGYGLGYLVIRLHFRFGGDTAPSDFLVLALMALAYAGAGMLHALGFIAVFAAGVGLRRAELAISRGSRTAGAAVDTARLPPPADELVDSSEVDNESLDGPVVAAGTVVVAALDFGETLERLLEVSLMILIGVVLATNWAWDGVVVALVFFVVVRPLSVWLSLAGTGTTARQRALIGWFGIRGIGSIYYLAYAFRQGIAGDEAHRLAALVMTIVTISVVAHGLTMRPLLSRYASKKARDGAGASARA
jgi:NhaP-type Na+/H+ or K+/H+ antiporter